MMKIIKVRQFMPRGPVVVTNYELPLAPFVTRHENKSLYISVQKHETTHRLIPIFPFYFVL